MCRYSRYIDFQRYIEVFFPPLDGVRGGEEKKKEEEQNQKEKEKGKDGEDNENNGRGGGDVGGGGAGGGGGRGERKVSKLLRVTYLDAQVPILSLPFSLLPFFSYVFSRLLFFSCLSLLIFPV